MEKNSSKKPSIRIKENGSIKVSNLEVFKNSREEDISTKEQMSLCRCGAAATKPFCDGTHRAIQFQDKKEPERVPDQLDIYKGEKITIRDNRGICSHAGFCTSGLPSVWRSGVEPWIDANGATPDEIKGIIHKCPSGALAYEEAGKIETSFHELPEIQVLRDGPYSVRGNIALENEELPEGVGSEHYALCRCGKSRNKPFCDGTHWYVGFKDDEALTISAANRKTGEVVDTWVEVGKVNDFKENEITTVTVNSAKVIIVNSKEGFVAFDATCPHQGGPLQEGSLTDRSIRCPWHGYEFSLKDGKGIGNNLKVEKLEIRENEGKIEVLSQSPSQSTWTVSHVVAETMVEWGINTVFGMVGHSNLGMAEAIRIQEQKGKIRYFGIRHEGAASFAASGYAKLTGLPAAVLSIAGPGATNLLTGLWDAKMDRAPVLALTGQVNTQVLGPGSFQEIDLASAFSAVSTFSQTMLPGSKYSELTSLALKSAVIEKSISHLILPDEVQVLDAKDTGPGRPLGRVSQTDITPPPQALNYAVYRIARAQRPVIIVGYGAREAMSEIIELAQVLDCPVITTFKAKGQISDHHPLAAGVLGRSGTPVASWLMNRSDQLVVFGASFSQHTGIDASKPIIQVDYDRMALGKFHPVDELVWGDIKTTANLIQKNLPEKKWHNQKDEIAQQWELWRLEKSKRETQDNGNGINSAVVFAQLSKILLKDAVIAVDVGNNTYSFGRYFECNQQSVLMSGYLGSIGFAFPAAMGAWAANSGRKIVSISGDGGFGQYMGELTTAVKYNMDITHILLNNNELGKISKEQRAAQLDVWQTDLHNPRFADYANLCGAKGYRVEKPDELAKTIEIALKVKGPSLVEIITDALLT
ncbi:MAG: thiamine pyrophosphate-dependent enzyme [Leptospirales bacterium]